MAETTLGFYAGLKAIYCLGKVGLESWYHDWSEKYDKRERAVRFGMDWADCVSPLDLPDLVPDDPGNQQSESDSTENSE
jgi:hypothetical protein